MLRIKPFVYVFLSLLCYTPKVFSQTGLVLPYLQNATPTSIVIMWETNVQTESTIEYGLTASLGNTVSGTFLNTSAGTVLHTVTIPNLTPHTTYYYRAKTNTWISAIYRFITPPLRNSDVSMNIVLMSDMQKDGSNPNIFSNLINTSLLPYIANTYGSPLEAHLQMALLPGDVVDNGNSYNQYKNDLFNPGQALWSYVPSYPAIGNHEVNSAHYFNYFNLPANGTPGYLEHWYSHDYSNVRVLSFNTNPGYRIAPQLAWLDSMLTESCADTLIDFVFAQMHHPFKSELWLPGEADYTGEIVARLEAFSDACGKPSIHFFGHTHAYSRGQSRDHEHLWVNVATSGGNIDYWGEYANADYDEFVISQDEYGFVMVEVTAGVDPQFTLKRLSFGDQYNPGGSTQTDIISVRKNNTPPHTPFPLFPTQYDTVSTTCLTLQADGFADTDGDEHGSTHWQVSADSVHFSNPVFESWKQHTNWYNETDLQANDDLTDEDVSTLPSGAQLFWRVRYRDKSLRWSDWSIPQRFHTRTNTILTGNLITNGGAESGVSGWTVTTGVLESLSPLECAGINPYLGQKYFAVGALCVEHPFASAYQSIDVSAFSSSIDSGNIAAHFGAFVADFANQDEPSFALHFLNAGNQIVGTTDTIRYKQNIWALRQQTVQLPVNTRSIRFVIMGTRYAGTDNDSYFDAIFLSLQRNDASCSLYQPPGPANGRIYVDQDAPATADGRSWETAYRTVGEAISQSNNDPTIEEIWIANGVYPVTTIPDRDSSYHITRAVSVYGGFASGEKSITERDIPLNPVILSGEQGNPEIATDNSYHVVVISHTADTNRLDGLAICCGYGDGVNAYQGGGLLYTVNNREPLYLNQCRFEDNVAMQGSSISNAGKIHATQCEIMDTEVPGISHASILNSGALAHFTLINSNVIRENSIDATLIENINGALLTVEENAGLHRD